jgi:hypothetical protein
LEDPSPFVKIAKLENNKSKIKLAKDVEKKEVKIVDSKNEIILNPKKREEKCE